MRWTAVLLSVALLPRPLAPKDARLGGAQAFSCASLASEAFQLPSLWSSRHPFLDDGSRGMRHNGSDVARPSRRQLFTLGPALIRDTANDRSQKRRPRAGRAAARSATSPSSVPKVDPFLVASYALDQNKTIVELVTDVPRPAPEGTVWIRYPANYATLARRVALKPLVTINELRVVLDLQDLAMVDEAIRGGVVVPDLRQSQGYSEDFFFWETAVAARRKFVLQTPADQVVGIAELAKFLGKSLYVVRDLVEAGALRPVETLWSHEDVRGLPYFLRSDLPAILRRFAPERVPHAYRLEELAAKLGRKERFIAFAIAWKIIQPEQIGPAGQPYYVASPKDLRHFQRQLKMSPVQQVRSPLPYPRRDLLTIGELAQALQMTTDEISKLIKSGDMPYFPVPRGQRTDSFFLADWVPVLREIFCPQRVPHAISQGELAAAIGINYETLRDLLDDGRVAPRMIGFSWRPYFVVLPEELAALRHRFHPDRRRISLRALAEKYGYHRRQVHAVANRLGLPVQTEQYGRIRHQYLAVELEATLAAHLPPKRPVGYVSKTETARRLRIPPAWLRELPADFKVYSAQGGYPTEYYEASRLPPADNFQSVLRWLERLRGQVPLSNRPRRLRTSA